MDRVCVNTSTVNCRALPASRPRATTSSSYYRLLREDSRTTVTQKFQHKNDSTGVSNTAHAGIRRNAIAETSTVAPIRNDLVSSLPQPHEKQNGYRLARTRG
jgi:hypothetical protein